MSNNNKFNVLRGTNFSVHGKERALWRNTLNRAKQGKIKMCDKFNDMQYFVKLIRKLPKYKEWLDSNRKYGFNSDTDEYNEDTVYFGKLRTRLEDKKYARVHRRTRKVEYYEDRNALADIMGYIPDTISNYRKSEQPLDGYFICYAQDVYKFI